MQLVTVNFVNFKLTQEVASTPYFSLEWTWRTITNIWVTYLFKYQNIVLETKEYEGICDNDAIMATSNLPVFCWKRKSNLRAISPKAYFEFKWNLQGSTAFLERPMSNVAIAISLHAWFQLGENNKPHVGRYEYLLIKFVLSQSIARLLDYSANNQTSCQIWLYIHHPRLKPSTQ